MMILFGAQYYRPPTPGAERWAMDFRRMKDAGLNTVQLWAVWGWMEPEPGQYVFDDYDRLMDLATEQDLQVVISVIADVQPFWMPRIHPEALMIDERGRVARGAPRAECLPGITPGCCTDHTQVRERTVAFMTALAERYHAHPALSAWDCWNETRWCVHCEHWVCYCEASLTAFRKYLHKQYKDLPTLGEAWGCRLVSWDDVYPSRKTGLLNPALMDFQRWLIQRARETAAWRRAALRAGDDRHFISAHSAGPITDTKWSGEEAPFARGNDFDNAAEVDGFGSSAFPAWFGCDPSDYGTRMEVARSVSAPKPFWNSELQGGAFNQGFT
ncbi:MAG: hypothetical protein EOM20_15400, partial [Spartobacteria bacterium]|nr:hypothetical protein [Spartobacteria bacterium]